VCLSKSQPGRPTRCQSLLRLACAEGMPEHRPPVAPSSMRRKKPHRAVAHGPLQPQYILAGGGEAWAEPEVRATTTLAGDPADKGCKRVRCVYAGRRSGLVYARGFLGAGGSSSRWRGANSVGTRTLWALSALPPVSNALWGWGWVVARRHAMVFKFETGEDTAEHRRPAFRCQLPLSRCRRLASIGMEGGGHFECSTNFTLIAPLS
jgi:hypothetical protein